jgi:SAM-dependent methyltransferase
MQNRDGKFIEIAKRDEKSEGAFICFRDGDAEVERRYVNLAYEAVVELLNNLEFETLLDVGSGAGNHSAAFRWAGKLVTSLDVVDGADIKADLISADISGLFDVVFCSHVLEHQRNLGIFLDAVRRACKPDGIICITVPPEVAHHFVLAHPNQFNAGLLLYHLIMAGIDCSEASVLTYGYNVSVIVRNRSHPLPLQAWSYEGECARYFPGDFYRNNKLVYGAITAVNWTPVLNIPPHENAGL